MLNFEPLAIDKMPRYQQLYNQSDGQSLANSFYYMWMNSKQQPCEWAFEDDICWIRTSINNKIYYKAPVGNISKYNIKELLKKLPPKSELIDIPEALAPELIKNGYFHLHEVPTEQEISFSVQDLEELPGDAYHVKRQHLKYFLWAYEYKQDEIRPKYIPDIKRMIKKQIDSPEKKENYNQICKILDNWKIFKDYLEGRVFVIKKQVQSVIIGEKTSKNYMLIHVEAENPRIKGLVAATQKFYLEKFNTINQANFGKIFIPASRYNLPRNIVSKYKLQLE